MANLKVGRPEKTIGSPDPIKPLISIERAAEIVGVGTATVKRMKRIKKKAKPEIVEAVLNNEMSIGEALKTLEAPKLKVVPVADNIETPAPMKSSSALSIAKQAMNIMRTIPEDDRLRKLAFQSVLDYIAYYYPKLQPTK